MHPAGTAHDGSDKYLCLIETENGDKKMKNKATMTVATNVATLVVSVNAGDTQKVYIEGPGGYYKELEGSGEGKTLLSETVGHGTYNIEGYSHAGGRWVPSTARKTGSRHLGFNDTGSDRDYDDTVVMIK